MRAVAVVLAGGQGKRMGPLCHDRPKPALPFAGGYRVIDFALSNCVNSGINDIIALTDYQHYCIASYLDQWRQGHLGDGLQVRKPLAGHYVGTADAVYQNLKMLQTSGADMVLVLAADHVYKMDYRLMFDFHMRAHADVTVGVAPVGYERASHFGIVRVGGDYRILDFVEKPSVPPGNLASMGIYLFNTDLLIARLEADAANPASSHDFGYDIIPAAIANDNAFAYRFNGFWQDVGTPQAYLEANLMLTQAQAPISLDGGWPVLTGDPGEPAAANGDQYGIVNCIVGSGCTIEGSVENSVISPGAYVARGAVVKDSVLMRGVSIGTGALVERAILDEGVVVGPFCNVGRTGGEVTILPRGTVIHECSPSLNSPGKADKPTTSCEQQDWRARVRTGRMASPLTIDGTPCSESNIATPNAPIELFGPGPRDMLVQCPKCKTVETLQFVGDTLSPSRKFSQRKGHVYHDCGSERPCRVHGQTTTGRRGTGYGH